MSKSYKLEDGIYIDDKSIIHNDGEKHTDLNSYLKEIKERFIYSTEERIIGKWIDGKTLYEKTYKVINPTAGETTEISLEELNYDFIKIPETTLDNSSYVFTFNRYNVGTTDDVAEYYIHKGNKSLRLNIGTPWSNCTFYITIHYTKTTD